MKSYVLAALLASASTYRLRQRFVDGMDDSEIIGHNPSNVQNTQQTCQGFEGEIPGKNCRSNNGNNLAEAQHDWFYLPSCQGVYGEKPGETCTVAPAARVQVRSVNDSLPECTGQVLEKPGVTCKTVSYQQQASNQGALSQGAPLSVYDPEKFKHYRPPFPKIQAGDTNIWKLQTCAGNKGEIDGETCTDAKAFHAKASSTIEPSRPNGTIAGTIPSVAPPTPATLVQDPSTGDVVVICNGANAYLGCIEPEDMKKPQTRPGNK